MKKKGLIISTAVMVVVLIAALTTGTFAWFTLAGKSEITGLNLTVESTADVTFGLKADGKFNASEVNTNSFSSGTVNFTAGDAGKPNGTWDGDIHGLSSITFGTGVAFSNADHKLSKAVGVATGVEATTAESSFDLTDVLQGSPTKSIITAVENTAQAGQITNVALAAENTDYLHLMLGVKAMNDVTKLSCKIEITLKDANTTLGLASALKVVYRLNKDKFEEEKGFYPGDTNYYTEKDKIKDGATAENGGNGTGVATIEGFDVSKINNFDLYIILAGYDDNCITAAALQGLSLEIKISFPTEKAGA